MVEWPENLTRDFARRRGVIVIGSGVSKHAIGSEGVRPPNWSDFLTQANSKLSGGPRTHIEDAISTGDFLHACEWLKKYYAEGWSDYLRDIFKKPKYKPAEIHNLIARIDSRIVFNLNFDDIYESAVNKLYEGDCTQKKYYDTDVDEFLRGSGRYIVKVHGSLDSPTKMIFTQKDYSHARIENSNFYKAFDAALMTHTFLFIGAGFNDPDVNLILENQRFTFKESFPHYFLASDEINEDRIESLLNNRNLKTITYDKIDANHSGLVQVIKDFLDNIEIYKQKIAAEQSW